MTGLFNRKEIQTRIAEAIKKSNDVSLIMFDIDSFKKVNDTYGHSEGDSVILALSNMIKNGIKKYTPYFSAGRWGGEEFMILCPKTTVEEAARIAEIIREDFASLSFEKAGHCTISLGVTQYNKNESADDLCNRVDEALYQSKASGKNKVTTL